MRSLLCFCLLSILCMSSCFNHSSDSEGITTLDSPSGSNSGEPNLFTSAEGEVYLSWIEKTESVSQLYYSKLENDSWQAPQLISEGNNWFVNWADFPSFIAGDDFFAAHWLQKRAEGTYDYDVYISTSKEGKNWTQGFIPHKDGVSAEHGFVSMLPMANQQFFATWLDGRNTKMENEDHATMGHAGAMTLRAGVFDLAGNTINAWELDNRTCDCCQTNAIMSQEGPIVVYRDRSENEIRDIYITRFTNNEWSTPMPVANDFWEIPGCPVNGPSVAISSENVGVIWYTASGNTPKVRLAISNDNGETFDPPINIIEGKTIGRVGITSLGNGHFVASWVETLNDQALIKLGEFDKNGNRIKELTVSETSIERASGFPVITSKDMEVIIAWTSNTENSTVQTAKFKF